MHTTAFARSKCLWVSEQKTIHIIFNSYSILVILHHVHITNNMELNGRSNFLLIMPTQEISILVGCFSLMHVNK